MTCFALLIFVAAPAHASERLTVHELHNFVNDKNHAMNNANLNVARAFLARTTSENAIFDQRINTYQHNYGYMNHVYYGHPAMSPYYRYPYNPYFKRTSTRSVGKWQQISLLEHKKMNIPGYRAVLNIENTVINPYATSAVIDIDMKEFGTAYNPASPTLASRVLHANSKCKAYVSKLNGNLILNRMDCNTNSNIAM
jgi:hypothetical protein